MVTPVPEHELSFRFIRASGPGGQNVNKVSTAVQLRWHVDSTTALKPEEIARLRRLAKNRINQEGELVIDARSERSQLQNREDAMRRLGALLTAARKKPKVRKPTKATKASKERRLESKKKLGAIKRTRQKAAKGDW